MTLDDLRVFAAVCESGSLSRVARELSRTQSAVSQHVKRLEAELGIPLFERQPRGVAVTQAGQILYQASARSISHIDDALRQLSDLRHGEVGSVRIATGATTVRHFMASAIAEIRRRHQNVNLEFRTGNSSRACLAALAAGEADLAWITLGAGAKGIEQRPVVELPWVLAVHAEDPLAGRDSVGPADLAGVHHIQLPEGSASRAQLDDQLARSGTRLTSTTSVADWDTAMLLAELGAGHAIVPAVPGSAAARPGRLRLIPIPMLQPLVVGWAVRQWSALSPLSREFAETVALSLHRPPGP